jgi:mannose-6-phosphate isomerase-like protein (cupin superfamily)
MMKQGKIWGTTEPLLITPMIEFHRINIEPFCHCSMHKHEFKYNMFYVIEGKLDIHVRKNNYDLTDITELYQGEFTSVAPNEYHMFQSSEERVEALEIYYLNPISEDIIRETVGGLNK